MCMTITIHSIISSRICVDILSTCGFLPHPRATQIESTWSPTAAGAFSTRLASDDVRLNNRSQWLVLPSGASPTPGAPQHVLFRTTFVLPTTATPGVGRARVAAALVGCGHVSLNGHRLGVDVLGSVSQLDKTVLYNTYDAMSLLRFNGGVNVLTASVGRCTAAVLGWLSDGGPTARIVLWYDDGNSGSCTEVVTTTVNNTWITACGPSNAGGNDEYLGESFDARVANALLGWESEPNMSTSQRLLWYVHSFTFLRCCYFYYV